MKRTFYSNGKLLITGEYTVLDGATALALPTKTGQYLDIEETSGNTIRWTSLNADDSIWLTAEIPLAAVFDNTQDGIPKHNTLVNILHHAHKANPELLKHATGFDVTTRLTFPQHWGLGSSSTLINNIAQWFGIDAFQLLNDSFGGSGYDIACAQNNTPILYRLENEKPLVTPVTFNPVFASSIYFIYLNRKQNSREAIAAYREQRHDIASVVSEIDNLSHALANVDDVSSFRIILDRHEMIMSAVLRTPTVKKSLFPNFRGSIKSLGAWGGDFVMAVCENDPTEYFRKNGFGVVVAYKDMIL
ncbi:GYDIA family GHMP kinase [uncultured Flavobacterium sp.]|uniref:GYDIA family GHMP kinase n=1 Tax=uncultured Flavobacterium sp. TaxID=165435 RepID=UPI0025D083D7|nr:GYDIA family GHMP kinase [uncultured Flavobacterium sp.]